MKTEIIKKLLEWQFENKHLLTQDIVIINDRFVHLHIKINSGSELRESVFDLKTGNYKILDSWTDEVTRKTLFDYESINWQEL